MGAKKIKSDLMLWKVSVSDFFMSCLLSTARGKTKRKRTFEM